MRINTTPISTGDDGQYSAEKVPSAEMASTRSDLAHFERLAEAILGGADAQCADQGSRGGEGASD
jgi:hypothetical protein